MKKLSAASSTVIGVASTAPLYSIAVTVGLIAAYVGKFTPLALTLAVIPMLCVFHSMGKLDKLITDQGTVYRWSKEAFNTFTGFFGGWALLISCVFVLSSLAYTVAEYGLGMFGIESDSAFIWTGVVVLAVFSWLSTKGIEFGAKSQWVLMSIQIVGLVLLIGIMISQFLSGAVETGELPGLTFSGMVHAILLGLFIYWGWDSTFSLTEESEEDAPQKGGFFSLVSLVVIYVIIGFLYLGDDVFESSPLLMFALAISAMASVQTTLIPTSRGLMSMARQRDLPRVFGSLKVATWVTAVLAAVWLVLSGDLFDSSIEAISIYIAVYYAMTCAAALVLIKETKTRVISGFGLVLMLIALAVVTYEFTIESDYSMIALISILAVVPVFFVAKSIVKKEAAQEGAPVPAGDASA